MIASKLNFNIIAVKFSEAMKLANKDDLPHYINLWEENGVEAIRLSAMGDISYSITIEGEKICEIKLIPYYGTLIHESVHLITENLINGSHKYVESFIRSEVGSIIDTVCDNLFVTALFTGGLRAGVTMVETKNGNMKFIDIYQNDKLVYSAPHSSGYEGMLTETLSKVLRETYPTNGMSISIP